MRCTEKRRAADQREELPSCEAAGKKTSNMGRVAARSTAFISTSTRQITTACEMVVYYNVHNVLHVRLLSNHAHSWFVAIKQTAECVTFTLGSPVVLQ